MVTKEGLQQIQERLNFVNKGNWHIIKKSRKYAPYDIYDGIFDRDDYEGVTARYMEKEVAVFIVNARNDIAALLNALETETARAENAEKHYYQGCPSFCSVNENCIRMGDEFEKIQEENERLKNDFNFLKSRTEALEKAVNDNKTCCTCGNYEKRMNLNEYDFFDADKNPCLNCGKKYKNWKFNEERFSEGGKNNGNV
jgi:hypothetical protein